MWRLGGTWALWNGWASGGRGEQVPELAMGCLSAGALVSNPQTARLDDADLVRAAQRGDVLAFEELVRLYDQSVLRLALNLVRSEEDARDIYQEAFLKIYRSLGSFRFECSFYTWVYRVVTNICLDHLRRKNVRKEEAPVVSRPDGEEMDMLDNVEDSRPGTNPERVLQGRELNRRIERAMNRLSPRERMVFELKHYQGLKLRTIGDLLNTTEETVKNCLFRATQKLRGALQGAV